MRNPHPRIRLPAWLALAAMALNTAWPLLANAKSSAASPQSEICSATGQKHADRKAPVELPHQGAQHCVLCPLNLERSAAIPPRAPALASAPHSAPAARAFDAPRREAALDPTAPPRAPPALS